MLVVHFTVETAADWGNLPQSAADDRTTGLLNTLSGRVFEYRPSP